MKLFLAKIPLSKIFSAEQTWNVSYLNCKLHTQFLKGIWWYVCLGKLWHCTKTALFFFIFKKIRIIRVVHFFSLWELQTNFISTKQSLKLHFKQAKLISSLPKTSQPSVDCFVYIWICGVGLSLNRSLWKGHMDVRMMFLCFPFHRICLKSIYHMRLGSLSHHVYFR